MIKINIEEKKILTENININDIILGKFNLYKNGQNSTEMLKIANEIKRLQNQPIAFPPPFVASCTSLAAAFALTDD